jgi:predicted PurR-regulated permease PerM
MAMSRLVSFLVLVAILVVIAVVFVRVMAGFFVPLFLAALLGVVIQPMFQWILRRVRGYRYVASTLTTTLVLVGLLLPIGLVITTATMEGLSLIDQLQLSNVRDKLDDLRTQSGFQIPKKDDLHFIEARLAHWRDQQRAGQSLNVTPERVDNLLRRLDEIEAWIAAQDDAPRPDARPLRKQLEALRDARPDTVDQDRALAEADVEFREFKRNLLGGTYRAFLAGLFNPTDEQIDRIRRSAIASAGPVVSFGGDTIVLFGKLVFGIVIMVVALFFFLAEGVRMVDGIVRISPLEEHYVRELVSEFDRACRAIVSATLISAIVQGVLAGVGFYFAGLESSVFLLMLLTMVLALVPFAGAAAVWIPVSLYLYFYEESLASAIGLALYGGIIVSQADNVIKPFVLHGQSNLHPLLALLSVLGGLQALGPIGILVGPMVVVFLQVLLRLVQREMSSIDRAQWFTWPPLAQFAGKVKAGAATVGATTTEPPPETRPGASTPPPGEKRAGNGQPGERTDSVNRPEKDEPQKSGEKPEK